jgi:POT family proton-dependent oligopeptide transporter
MAPSTAPASAATPTRGHPKGLYLLFTTEMWERLSYYGMRAILVLYLTSKAGGFGWSDAQALSLYGTYTSLVYLTPVIGGWLADRYLGQRRALYIGGVLMMIGHFLLALPGIEVFYAALGFLIVGNGFFKPNISTMVGGLYAPGDARRDSAFTIFYMGINLGGAVGPLLCGWLGEEVGWHYGFGAAGVGMGLGLLSFLFFSKKLLGTVGLPPAKVEKRVDAVADSSQSLTRVEWHRILVIFALSFFVIIFWAAFEQSGGLMNLYTDRKVDRMIFGWEFPASVFQSVNSIFILLLAPMFAELWIRLAARNRDLSIPAKMAVGLLLLSFGFVLMLGASRQSAAEGKAALLWVIGAYFFHTAGELCLSPVGLSMVTKLAPARYVSLLMGVWFLANAVANKLAGFIGGYAETLGEFEVFLGIVALTAVSGVVLLALAPALKRMMHGADEVRSAAQEASAAAPSANAAV